MSATNRDSFGFFLSNMDAFYFSCLIALSEASSAVLNRSGKSEYPCLFPNLKGKSLSISLSGMMLWVFW